MRFSPYNQKQSTNFQLVFSWVKIIITKSSSQQHFFEDPLFFHVYSYNMPDGIFAVNHILCADDIFPGTNTTKVIQTLTFHVFYKCESPGPVQKSIKFHQALSFTISIRQVDERLGK